jgi:hypothetical protein
MSGSGRWSSLSSSSTSKTSGPVRRKDSRAWLPVMKPSQALLRSPTPLARPETRECAKPVDSLAAHVLQEDDMKFLQKSGILESYAGSLCGACFWMCCADSPGCFRSVELLRRLQRNKPDDPIAYGALYFAKKSKSVMSRKSSLTNVGSLSKIFSVAEPAGI